MNYKIYIHITLSFFIIDLPKHILEQILGRLNPFHLETLENEGFLNLRGKLLLCYCLGSLKTCGSKSHLYKSREIWTGTQIHLDFLYSGFFKHEFVQLVAFEFTPVQ